MSSQTPTQKRAPRQINGEGTPINGGSPRHVTSTPRSRFSSHGSPSSGARSPGGTTLFVSGMGSSARRRLTEAGGSAAFRSTTTIGDAHIKDCSLRITPGPYSAAKSNFNGNGTAAFRSKSPSDRDAHMRTLLTGTYGSPRSNSGYSPSRGHQLPSASFRSASPTACAHINAMPKPLDASYGIYGSPNSRHHGSAAFRSTTSIADAHIKASPKMHDSTIALTPRSAARECTSPFRSTTSIGDAHIKALPKPVDVVVAYRD